MLHKETVASATLELLTGLMQDKRLENFILVGGTALSLQIGHRKSIDLDFFSVGVFNENELSVYLESKNSLQVDFLAPNTLKGSIKGVTVDFITHAYPMVHRNVLIDDIRMASLEDIAAFKLNAIIGNGTRLKDFVDVGFLSEYLSLTKMLAAFEKKYSSRNPVMAVKALAYHNDINFQEPLMLIGNSFEWNAVANRIQEMIRFPDKSFPRL
jgi:predicted nucleotidyltransferase component of viral defense system